MKRVGVIGLGMAAAPHALSLADLKDRVEVAGVYSPSVERRTAFGQRFGLPAVDSADVLFDDPSVDYLVLLTPPNTHLELVQRAVNAGKHVLLEKPLEVSLERSRQLVGIAEQAGIRLGVVLQRRFRKCITELKAMLDRGELGEISSVSAKLSNWRPQSYYDEPGRGTLARDGGGVLLTQAIHTIDQMIALAGLPEQVAGLAITSGVHRMETEDLVHAVLHYPNGAVGTLSATTAAFPGFPDVIEIIGTAGTARLEGDRGQVFLMDGRTIELADEAGDGGTGADPMAFSHHNHRSVHADFLDALDTGRPPKVSGVEALKAHLLIDAVLRSAREGQFVPCVPKKVA